MLCRDSSSSCFHLHLTIPSSCLPITIIRTMKAKPWSQSSTHLEVCNQLSLLWRRNKTLWALKIIETGQTPFCLTLTHHMSLSQTIRASGCLSFHVNLTGSRPSTASKIGSLITTTKFTLIWLPNLYKKKHLMCRALGWYSSWCWRIS